MEVIVLEILKLS